MLSWCPFRSYVPAFLLFHVEILKFLFSNDFFSWCNHPGFQLCADYDAWNFYGTMTKNYVVFLFDFLLLKRNPYFQLIVWIRLILFLLIFNVHKLIPVSPPFIKWYFCWSTGDQIALPKFEHTILPLLGFVYEVSCQGC